MAGAHVGTAHQHTVRSPFYEMAFRSHDTQSTSWQQALQRDFFEKLLPFFYTCEQVEGAVSETETRSFAASSVSTVIRFICGRIVPANVLPPSPLSFTFPRLPERHLKPQTDTHT